MKKTIYLILLVILFFSACKSDDNPVTTSNTYAGNWSFVLAGSVVGSGQMAVDSKGDFNFNILVISGGQSFTDNISGNITSGGSLSAKIYYAGSQVGTASGTFTGNSGTGTYSATGSSGGTWSAARN